MYLHCHGVMIEVFTKSFDWHECMSFSSIVPSLQAMFKYCYFCCVLDDSKFVSFSPASVRNQSEPYDHVKDAAFFYDVTEQFKKGMKFDPTIKSNYEVTTIAKVTIQKGINDKLITVEPRLSCLIKVSGILTYLDTCFRFIDTIVILIYPEIRLYR